MTGVLVLDNPWQRLPWSLPLALAICTGILWEFGYFLERPPLHQTPPASIEAELIDLPPPPVEEHIVQAKPEPAKPAPRRASVPTPEPVALPPAPAASADQNSVPAPPPVSAAPSAPTAPDARFAGTANMAAQAIVRPLPRIPDDLREEAFDAVAVARFHIGADGSATVELAKPTSNPRLNRLLMESLKEWRFSPAIRDGRPVPSVQELRIGFEVK